MPIILTIPIHKVNEQRAFNNNLLGFYMNKCFHSQPIEKVFKELKSSDNGLGETEVLERLKEYGENSISESHKRTALDIFINQFKNFLIWLLFLAAGIAYFIGHMLDAIAILIACIISIIFGFALEYRADASLRALKELAVPKALVMRDGKHRLIDAKNLVPGDVVTIEEGNKVPADGRIIYEYDLETNEAILTGESAVVAKSKELVPENAAIHEKRNIVYSGTLVTKGRARIIVIAIGNESEFGKIASALAKVESEETVLQIALDDLGKKVSIISFVIILVLVGVGIFKGLALAELAILAISLAVATVPEGLLTVLTIILALGVRRMAEKNALIRSLHAVETIGNVTMLVVDKTGTITEGRLQLSTIYQNSVFHNLNTSRGMHSTAPNALLCATYCNTAKITDEGIIGDELDTAIIDAAMKKYGNASIAELRQKKAVAFFPFTSEKKLMSGVYEIEHKRLLISKGAPEVILSKCNRIEINGKIEKLANKAEMLKALGDLTSRGMRVIGVGYKEARSLKEEETEQELVFLGFLGFMDKPRLEAKGTIDVCKNAGVSVLMLTGDNLGTALRIGKDIGLVENEDETVEWNELKDLSKKMLAEHMKNIKIVARSTPLAKLRIVEALIECGETIAVTGDGVNDAPALKKAHVGVVMGSGSDVSKEAGSLVLLDNNFATLVSAVEHGRSIFHNIIAFIRFQFTTTFAMFGLFISTFLISFFMPIAPLLNPIQILFINIVMDGPPALALGLEKGIVDVLKEKPRRNKEILSKDILISISTSAMFMLLVLTGVYIYYSGNVSQQTLLTIIFLTFSFLQLFNALNCRFSHTHFYTSPTSNPYVFLSVLAMGVVLVAIVYEPWLSSIFGVVPLALADWYVVLIASATILLFEEIKKYMMVIRC